MMSNMVKNTIDRIIFDENYQASPKNLSKWERMWRNWDKSDCSEIGLIAVYLQYLLDNSQDSYEREHIEEGIRKLVSMFEKV